MAQATINDRPVTNPWPTRTNWPGAATGDVPDKAFKKLATHKKVKMRGSK